MDNDKPKQLQVIVGVLIVKNGQFLMIERSGGDGTKSWSIPSTTLEFGESPEVAASKAAMEKVALVVGNPRFGAVTNDIHDFEGLHYLTLWLLADWQGGEPVPRDETISKVDWYDFESLPQPLSQPWNGLLNSNFLKNLRMEISQSAE